MKRFEKLGLRIMNRAPGRPDDAATRSARCCPIPTKRADAAQILGQAYVIAFNFVRAEPRGRSRQVAETLIERREMHGDEVVELLDEVGLVEPAIDLTQERAWPKL